ncbi:MAG: hexitol phosphatase HxpB [Chitinophagaceae bacterium]|nr:hexitol phosphatase HxpB [Chitinophagaceae bacterium]
MLTTVIFDMDGLLVDSEPLWRLSMKEVFATVGVEISVERAAYTTGLRTPEVVEYWYNEFKWKGKTTKQVTEEIIDDVIGKITTQGQAMQGIEYIFGFFQQRGFKTGLASSSPMRLIEAVVGYLGIGPHFQVMSSAEFETHGKPHPAVYLSCAAALKSHPLECIAFEDSLTGMIAAKAARMRTVVVPEEAANTDSRFSLADAKLNSLLEFDEALLQKLQ